MKFTTTANFPAEKIVCSDKLPVTKTLVQKACASLLLDLIVQ